MNSATRIAAAAASGTQTHGRRSSRTTAPPRAPPSERRAPASRSRPSSAALSRARSSSGAWAAPWRRISALSRRSSARRVRHAAHPSSTPWPRWSATARSSSGVSSPSAWAERQLAMYSSQFTAFTKPYTRNTAPTASGSPGDPALAGECRQRIAHHLAPARNPRLDGADRASEHLRGLLVVELLDVDQDQDRAKVGGQRVERGRHLMVEDLLGEQRLGIVGGSVSAHAGSLQLALEVLRGCREHLARAAAVAVAEVVVQDGEQPRAAVGARGVLMEEAVGAQHGLLQQVAGVVGIARKAQRRRVQGVDVSQRLALEERALFSSGAPFFPHIQRSTNI